MKRTRMAETPRPPSIFQDIRALMERLRVQESANRQAGGGITDGALLIYDEDGQVVAFLGTLASGVTGIQIVQSPTVGMFHISDVYGWAQPYLGSSWVRTTESIATTSGTFEDVYRVRMEQATGIHVRFQVYFMAAAGTTGEIRCAQGATPLGPTYVIGDGHAAWHEFAYPFGAPLYTGPYEIQLEARVTSGAGPITVFRPYDLAQGYYTGVIPVTGWIS
jgi:hypothetical protein